MDLGSDLGMLMDLRRLNGRGEAGRGEAGIRMRMIIGEAFDTWWSYLPVSIILQLNYSVLFYSIYSLPYHLHFVYNQPVPFPSLTPVTITALHCIVMTGQDRSDF